MNSERLVFKAVFENRPYQNLVSVESEAACADEDIELF